MCSSDLRSIRGAAMRRLLDELSDEEIAEILAAMPALARLAGKPLPAGARR